MGNCLGDPRGVDQLILSEEGGYPGERQLGVGVCIASSLCSARWRRFQHIAYKISFFESEIATQISKGKQAIFSIGQAYLPATPTQKSEIGVHVFSIVYLQYYKSIVE